MKELQAESIYNLAKEHKKTCNIEKCGVSLYALGLLYAELLDRGLKPEERKVFS